jgi:hypothetical protein
VKKRIIINKLAQILSYEDLTIKIIIEELENETSKNKKLRKLLCEDLYPNKTKKQII